MTRAVWINGRFLEQQPTGVERVAREMVGALGRRLDEQGVLALPGVGPLRFRLVVPENSSAKSPWSNVALDKRGMGGGHSWEQVGLLLATRGDWLVSLCNTGPMVKRRHLLFLHDAAPFAIPGNFTWRFAAWYRIVFVVGGRVARCLMTNSSFSRQEHIRHVGLLADKIKPVWLGADHVLNTVPDESILHQAGLSAFSYVLAVASLSWNKNIAAVLRALQLLGDEAPPCVIVGQRYDRVFGNIAFDSARVKHVGYVSDAQLYALYRGALCLVFPSLYEGFGLPPLEAMALGCPAIVSSDGVLPEVCGNAALYCDSHDPRSLAHAIVTLRNDPGRRTELRALGFDHAARFTWSRTVDTLLDVLAQGMRATDGKMQPKGPECTISQ